jgi:epoxide hydrolase 4
MPVLPELLLAAGGGSLLVKMLRNGARNRDAFPAEVLEIYRANVSAPGAASAMLNWYRAGGRDVLAARDLAAPVETPTLIIWGELDVALGLPCLDGTDRYVRDLRIYRLPGVSHFAQEDAPQEVNRLLGKFL